jgi:hypothetical protein
VRDDNGVWHMFYLGTPNSSPAPDYVPFFPYLTLKARATSLLGPWTKQREVLPFDVKPATFRETTASPGAIIRHGDEFLQFYSGSVSTLPGSEPAPGMPDMPAAKAARRPDGPYALRTLGMARTRNLDGAWQVDDEPIVPLDEQVENSSLYYEESIGTWFLFTNHVGCEPGPGKARCHEFTDAAWVYWSKDPTRWNSEHKAVVLDGENCSWSKRCVGMPTVHRVGTAVSALVPSPRGPRHPGQSSAPTRPPAALATATSSAANHPTSRPLIDVPRTLHLEHERTEKKRSRRRNRTTPLHERSSASRVTDRAKGPSDRPVSRRRRPAQAGCRSAAGSE